MTDVIERLGDLLRAAGYGGDLDAALRGMPGGVPPVDLLTSRGTEEEARLATLLRLFVAAKTIELQQAEKAFAPLRLNDLSMAGVLELDGSGARARMSLSTIGDLIIAGDPWSQATDEGFVANISRATETVANLMIPVRAGRALDMGTGSGVLALLAARHAERVTGVDINPRALNFARMNASLNAVENVTWTEGDWFEPVRDERFDLVLGNLPFVISPDEALTYRDVRGEADELPRRLTKESAEHLAEGGFATMMCNWIHPERAWEEPLREWVVGLGCDAVLLHFESHDPLFYSMIWNSDPPAADGVAFQRAVDRWVENFERLGAKQVGMGMIILRRRSDGPNWTETFQLPDAPTGPGGPQLERIFSCRQFLASQPAGQQSQAVLSGSWRLVDGHHLDHRLTHANGGYRSTEAVLKDEPGLNLPARIDARAIPLLSACDGRRPLGEVIGSTPIPDGLDQGSFQRLGVSTVMELMTKGYIVADQMQRD